MVASINVAAMGLMPNAFSAFMIISPAYLLLVPNIVSTSVAGAEVGCYRYRTGCCRCSAGCFRDRPAALRPFRVMIAALVISIIGYFPLLTQTWTCTLADDYYSIQGYCAFVGLWMLLAHVLSFTSVVLWLNYWNSSSKHSDGRCGGAGGAPHGSELELRSSVKQKCMQAHDEAA